MERGAAQGGQRQGKREEPGSQHGRFHNRLPGAGKHDGRAA